MIGKGHGSSFQKKINFSILNTDNFKYVYVGILLIEFS